MNGQPFEIYTDGACSGNPGPGGWGALLVCGGETRELWGGEAHTTNNRMELTAVIQALATLKRPAAARVYTDSTYVQQGISLWIRNWKKRGWRTADRKAVKNVDLWQALDTLAAPHRLEWVWVRGHAGNPGNERADQLARRGIARQSSTDGKGAD
ncbi:MAG: ribonuclease HI [Zoogloeaceae bacterium]|jgi:ribonuclease HI|nr:ribonuclease HI [Zoogloeaceae bacterium]